MTKQQIPKLASALVEHQECFGDLSTDESQWVIMNTAAAIAVCVSAVKVAFAKVNQILDLVSSIVIAATTGKFIAKGKFVVNIDDDAPMKISHVWDNFTAWFLVGKGKIEDPIAQQTLRYHKLRQSSPDGPIIAELGGEAKVETTLTEVYALMAKQPNGEEGALLNNGWWNIFYVKDLTGTLRAVCVSWYGGGWCVYADSVEGPRDWGGGRQVFSRNS